MLQGPGKKRSLRQLRTQEQCAPKTEIFKQETPIQKNEPKNDQRTKYSKRQLKKQESESKPQKKIIPERKLNLIEIAIPPSSIQGWNFPNAVICEEWKYASIIQMQKNFATEFERLCTAAGPDDSFSWNRWPLMKVYSRDPNIYKTYQTFEVDMEKLFDLIDILDECPDEKTVKKNRKLYTKDDTEGLLQMFMLYLATLFREVRLYWESLENCSLSNRKPINYDLLEEKNFKLTDFLKESLCESNDENSLNELLQSKLDEMEGKSSKEIMEVLSNESSSQDDSDDSDGSTNSTESAATYFTVMTDVHEILNERCYPELIELTLPQVAEFKLFDDLQEYEPKWYVKKVGYTQEKRGSMMGKKAF